MLKGKSALITGASRGIGRAIASLFADQGRDIAFTYIYEDKEAEELTKQLQEKGIKVLCINSDAANFEAAHQVIEQTIKAFGKLDILVCNAGIARDTLLMRMSEDQWDSVLDVNLKSVFNYCHAVTPHMMRQKSGSIIAMSSVVGIGGNAGQANYAASKAGIIAFTKSVAKELGARGIRANAIAPGFIMTEMTAALNKDTLKQFVSLIPMRRGGTPEEVAKVALFLASDLSSYVSGQVIQVNGAMG